MATQVKIGTRFRSALADGNPLWEVTKKLGRGVWKAAVVNEPIEYEGRLIDSDYVGTTRAFRTRDIAGSLRVEAAFAASHRKHEAFYESLAVGATVHYHNGFGNYVRCEVVYTDGEKRLLPVALVGNWRDYDLKPDAYHRKKIENGETFLPHASNVYENPSARLRGSNPADMEPIEFSDQPERARARKEATT